jgi:ABC-type polysaccharide/polyol phosphate export permease
MATLSELRSSRELMVNLTLRELRGKYKRSALGWLWSLLNPLATMAIFTVVFSYLLKIQVEKGDPSGLHNFSIFLLCGLLPWNYLANGMSGSMGALIGNANLIKKVYFPREILVSANVASWGVALLIELGVLAVVLLLVGNMVIPWLPILLVLVALQTLFVTGIGLGLAVLNVYFRDVQHLMGILIQLWFYATPIVYPITYVTQHADPSVGGVTIPLQTIYKLNPMVQFVEGYRDVLYDLRFPSLARMAFLVVVSLGTLLIGYAVFVKLEGRLAEEL